MNEDKKFVIRCRAIILHESKLLVVRHHNENQVYALPGGHLEWGEGIKECMDREVIEELGVKPEIGRLLYVNTYQGETKQPFEFFFEVKNGADYLDTEKLSRTHAHEIMEIRWIDPAETLTLLPAKLAEDFRAGAILADEPRFIMNNSWRA